MTRSAFFAHLANNCHVIDDVAEQDTVWKKAITCLHPNCVLCILRLWFGVVRFGCSLVC